MRSRNMGQPALSGMAFTVHRAQVEELVTERVALVLLREKDLQSHGKLAQPSCFRPGFLRFVQVDWLREQAVAAARALIETGQKLFAEDAVEGVDFGRIHGVAWVHFVAYLGALLPACMAASISSGVWGRLASRSMSLPSAVTRKSHSMRTPIFSSGI